MPGYAYHWLRDLLQVLFSKVCLPLIIITWCFAGVVFQGMLTIDYHYVIFCRCCFPRYAYHWLWLRDVLQVLFSKVCLPLIMITWCFAGVVFQANISDELGTISGPFNSPIPVDPNEEGAKAAQLPPTDKYSYLGQCTGTVSVLFAYHCLC